jgi:diguanylate cyclase (GGDEF)-like protein/PAS domain S-box-containing protein
VPPRSETSNVRELKNLRGHLEIAAASPRTVVTRGVVVDIAPMREAVVALRHSEALNRAVVDALAEGVVVLAPSGDVVLWNASALDLLGAEPEDLRSAAAEVLAGATLLRRGGRWLRGRAGAGPAPGALHVVSFEDVTDRHEAAERLRAERDRAQRYLDVASTMMVVIGADARIALLNRKGGEVLGHAEHELLGRDWFEAVVPAAERLDARLRFTRQVSGVDAHQEHFESSVVTREGEARVIAWHSTLLRGDDGAVTGVLRSGEDVTERRRAEEQVRFLAYHDRLTGLPNRVLLEEHLTLALARSRRTGSELALLELDLDQFRLVNDSLGHAAGDRVLRETGERLAAVTRAQDLLAHAGGDTFLLLLADLEDGAADAATVVARIARETLEAPFDVDGARFHLSASVGVALSPRHGDTADELLKRADAAVSQAKRRGDGIAVYEPPAVDARTRLSLTARLRRAIERDELELHFQPVVDPAGGELTGAEALVRWRDPEHGLIPPAVFIPTAEETGLIESVGEWVVETVCRQAAEWGARYDVPRLGFNLSPRELRRDDLAGAILATARYHGVRPDTLVAELTETSIMATPQRTEALLGELAAAGFNLALDDFGTGHSSLFRLRQLPFRVLKIDRAFLRGVPEDGGAASVVAAVVALGRALGMSVVAEGVETEAQRAFLVAHGCPHAQGFLLHRPMPAADFAALLAQRSPRAATSTIDASMSHSTGARSSV